LGGFFRGGRPLEFVELFEETEFALEGAFGGGCVAKAEIVFFDLVGVQLNGEGPWVRAITDSRLRWARMRCHSA